MVQLLKRNPARVVVGFAVLAGLAAGFVWVQKLTAPACCAGLAHLQPVHEFQLYGLWVSDEDPPMYLYLAIDRGEYCSEFAWRNAGCWRYRIRWRLNDNCLRVEGH